MADKTKKAEKAESEKAETLKVKTGIKAGPRVRMGRPI